MRTSHLPVLALFASLIACGKLASDEENTGKGRTIDPAPNDDVPTPATPADVPARRTDLSLQAYATLRCQTNESCGVSSNAIFTAHWGTHDRCVEGRQRELAEDLALPGVTVTQAQLDACAARQAATPCEERLAECDFRGTLAAGTTCQLDAQCATGDCDLSNEDFSTPGVACGTCRARSKEREACRYGSDCELGLTCNEATKKCMTPLTEGASCVVAEAACGPGLGCLNGVCAKSLPEGAECTFFGWIHFGYHGDCAAGLYCGREPGQDRATCKPFPRVTKRANVGEPCGLDIGSCVASSCDRDAGVCVPQEPTSWRWTCDFGGK